MAKFFIFPFAIAGDVIPIPNTTQPSGSVSYEQGFPVDYQLPYGSNPSALAIPRGSMNQLFLDITEALQQYQTHSVPDFITTLDTGGVPYPYDIYAQVRYDAGSGVQVWENLVAGNITTPGADSTWQVISGGALGYQPGDLADYAGGTVRTGFLLCDGSAVSRTTYANLFSAIGVLWGTGDGSTTFNLPDFRRRTAVGSGGPGTNPYLGNAVGNVGGEEAHAQTLTELFPHTHGPGGANNEFTLSKTVSNTGTTGIQGTPSPRDYTATPLTDFAGGGQAFNVIQPSAIVTMMIKY